MIEDASRGDDVVLSVRGTDTCRECAGTPIPAGWCSFGGCRADARTGHRTCEDHTFAEPPRHSCEVKVGGRWVKRDAAGVALRHHDTSPQGRAERLRELGITR